MTSYDPFARGPLPVGVVTRTWHDADRERTLPVELWYPAAEACAGRDRDPAQQDRFQPTPMAPERRQEAVRDAPPREGRFPLVVFSHGFGGERRQTTHLCTHLASHGYAVASADHVGNTTQDLLQFAMAAQAGEAPPDPVAAMRGFARDRPADASLLIDRCVAGEGPVAVDEERIGIAGHSFGGWTALQTTARDARIRAALPLAPAGAPTPLTAALEGALERELDLAWGRPVPTLFLVADQDTLLPLDGMRVLVGRTPRPRRALVLHRADHFHFCDGVRAMHDLFRQMAPLLAAARPGAFPVDALLAMRPSGELCPEDHAYAFLQGPGLLHMDAHLRRDEGALALLSGDLAALLRARGIEASELDGDPRR